MTGIKRIAKERKRQIEKEGWTVQHDEQHSNDELAEVAICYIRQATFRGKFAPQSIPRNWPSTWNPRWWKPEPRNPGIVSIVSDQDAIRMLEKAGALIAAEIDRIQAEDTP